MAAALKITVRRSAPVLVAPAGPTPRELKRLSDIDDQEGLRFQVPNLMFYRRSAAMAGRDPSAVIRDAVARALVHYYPFAGRIRELEGRKLAVDCTGEGVLFTEADADVRLSDFGDVLLPPFPGHDDLIYDIPGTNAILGCPLLLFQVTRLTCGGFILAVRLNHTMADAQGLLQFLGAVAELSQGAVAELSQGAAAPTVTPIWGREMLEGRNPPRPWFSHREYDEVPDTKGTIVPIEEMVHESLLFGPREIASVRTHLPPALRRTATRFDIIVGCLWKCRTMALAPDADEAMRMICISSARVGKDGTSAVPAGYYGNSFAFPVAISAAGALCANPVGYAVELVKKAKAEVDFDYIRSVADLMVQRGRPHITVVRAYVVSDVTRAGFGEIDFGWGKPLYGGPSTSGVGVVPGMGSFLIPVKTDLGEDATVVPLYLPPPAMDVFLKEMGRLMRPAAVDVDAFAAIKSAL